MGASPVLAAVYSAAPCTSVASSMLQRVVAASARPLRACRVRGKGLLRRSLLPPRSILAMSLPSKTASRYFHVAKSTNAVVAPTPSSTAPMFRKVLIANRGEISVRVSRTCRGLGVQTVAVYSEQDRGSLHVQAADEAVLLGPAAASQSYLDAAKIIRVALETGAQAIHPGYGFLSENAAFSRACSEAGIVFIGPPPTAIEAMGSKSEAKRIMSAAGVPITPGYYGDDQTVDRFIAESQQIGYPVLIKAVHGGGGKGMRLVHAPEEMAEAMESARREAIKSFGSEGLLVEKYIVRPRHVEVQVFADNHNNAVYLFERDCSVQRRHQKIIEEAPAPNISEELRERLGQAAVNAAKAVGYRGAGTVEFILDCDAPDGRFYFMEMNTRLQVEHPITEMITQQDLVHWQLLVASGQPLPLTQRQLKIHGHAFEARVYAENPENNFLPAPGPIVELCTPAETFVAGSGSAAYRGSAGSVRVDTGIRQGDNVSMFYDPMIAKLIVHDVDRTTALRRLHQQLGEFHVRGLHTNLRFLLSLSGHPSFVAADLDTGFIERHRATLFSPPTPRARENEIAILATLQTLLDSVPPATTDPWSAATSLRLSGVTTTSAEWSLRKDAAPVSVLLALGRDSASAQQLRDAAGRPVPFAATAVVRNGGQTDSYRIDSLALLPNGELSAWLTPSASAEQAVVAAVVRSVPLGGDMVTYVNHDVLHRADNQSWEIDGLDHPQAGALSAPMPGKIVRVVATRNQQVRKGDALILMEAMKMEHTIRAPFDGVVRAIHFAVGDQVEEKAPLIEVERAA